MFSRPEVTVPTALLEANAARAAQSPRLMQVAFERDVRYLRPLFLRILAPKGAHKRPTAFQSPKQRRWWYGVGRKTWRGRTGAQEKGYRTDTRTSTAGGLFRFWNVNPSSVYIQGRQQQRMHRGTWITEDEALAQFQPLAEERIRQSALTVFDYRAGVR